MKKKLLVFPCGSEVALEIYRSLQYSIHFELIGGSSIDDHGRFIYDNYIGGLPFHHDPLFIPTLKEIIRKEKIDGIFPAMDAVAKTLKYHEEELGCVVIGSGIEATTICSSKLASYKWLSKNVQCPEWETELKKVINYPIFIKPDEGYGSKNVCLAPDRKSAQNFINKNPEISFIFCEYLPGEEFTIDCFSNSQGLLLFSGVRQRARISNGISVNTFETRKHAAYFHDTAEKINQSIKFRGAWFFQMKENIKGEPTLLEVAVRLSGSSSCFRAKGVNFALLSAFDAYDFPVDVVTNNYHVELDRALSNSFKINIEYEAAYIDFDDCLLLGNTVNTTLIRYIFDARNKGIKVTLITRHAGDIYNTLEKYRLDGIFDDIIHIKNGQSKSNFIVNKKSIFIDDSFSERSEVKNKHGIPVFSPDMVESLL